MAFLLTVFDARLGWWLGNPRWRLASERSGPAFALWYLLAELLGRATARKRFVNLSDGGHFDNLGLYELVRRRCRYIVIVDGEEDGQLTFGSLGGAIRKCRADFGVEIDINPDPIRLGARKFSGAHCVMGTITYPEAADPTIKLIDEDVEAATDRNRAWLFYLKSSLTGDEPADVIEYHSRNHEFPHQSTADQFFSESQFESYRRLGLHLARSAFEDVLPWQAHGGGAVDVATVFRRLTRKWYAPISVTPEAASRLADAYSSLMRTLRERPDLEPLLPCLLGLPAGRQQPDINDREQLLFITEVLQLMENVFTEYRFEQAANRTNPRSAGWMRVFRMWTNPHQFLYTQAWQLLRSNYNTLFQEFVETLATTEREPHDVPNRP